MENNKVTIGMCVYNPSVKFTQVISCWLPHLNEGHELLIYDDGSEIPISNIVSNEIHGIKIIRSELNKGIGYGRNVIYSKAKNDFIMFADSDDISHLDRIRVSLDNYFSKSKMNHANLVYASSQKKYNNGNVFIEQTVDSSFEINEFIKLQTHINSESFYTPASVLMFSRREVNTSFDESFKRLEDIDWLWQINSKMPINLISTKEVLIDRYDEFVANKKINLNSESEKRLFEKYSSIIGNKSTKFNVDWSRLKSSYLARDIGSFMMLFLKFIVKYKAEALSKLLIGGKRRLKKC